MGRDLDAIIKQKYAETGDVGLGGLTLADLWPISYSTPGGPFPQRIQFNQLFRYLSALGVEINEIGPFLDYNGSNPTGPDYLIGAIVRGSNSELYKCLIANGPSSTIVNPVGDVTGTWKLISVGTTIQRVYTETGAVATGTDANLGTDDNIPQITEGDEYMTRTITPKSASNILMIEAIMVLANSAAQNMSVALFQDAVSNGLALVHEHTGAADKTVTIALRHFMIAGTTSEITFRIRAGGSTAGTTTFNGIAGARIGGGVMASSIAVTEYTS